MADKQLARSETIDLSTFADDDPLSELARIVTHDHRPAVEQLKELERHRQSMRFDPVVDLEEELLREFDAYDAPAAAAPAVIAEPKPRTPPAAQPVAPVEPVLTAAPIAPIAPVAPPSPAILHQPIAPLDQGFDLERELTLSMVPETLAQAAPVRGPGPAAAAPVIVKQAGQGEPTRRAAYPFTPNFSRATPVAGGGQGQGQGRTFATPLPQAPVVAPPVAPAPVVAPAAAQIEPEFDLEAFEMDLAEAAMDIDDLGTSVAAPVAASAPTSPAAPVSYAPSEDYFEELPEAELPFDPAMIAESDETPPSFTDFEVPQLPVIEEAAPVLDQGDYDLDIDAEMVHIFSAGQQSAAEAKAPQPTQAIPPVSRAAPPAANGRAPLADFDEFERVMQADFRRSVHPRQEVLSDGDIPEPRAIYANDDVAEGRGRRRLMLMASAAVIVLVAGGVAAFTLLGGSAPGLGNGEPQIILADKSPTKMVPLDKGGKTVPNQDKAVYDRVAGAAQEQPQQDTLVSSTEEPIDVVQRTLTPETLPLQRGEDGDDMAVATPIEEDGDRLLPEDGVSVAQEDAKPAVEPRKVRTMIVKPDGTLVARDDSAPAEDSPLITTVKTTALKPSEPATDVTTATTRPSPERLPAETDAVGALAAAASATTRGAGAEAAAREAIPVAKPVEVAKASAPVVDTFATPAKPSASDAAPASQPAVAGGYAVQIASLPSEGDAKVSMARMSSKFGSVIGGRAMEIRKAEIAGKGTYYRVRVSAGSRDEANALCAKLKSAGGSCLVTK